MAKAFIRYLLNAGYTLSTLYAFIVLSLIKILQSNIIFNCSEKCEVICPTLHSLNQVCAISLSSAAFTSLSEKQFRNDLNEQPQPLSQDPRERLL